VSGEATRFRPAGWDGNAAVPAWRRRSAARSRPRSLEATLPPYTGGKVAFNAGGRCITRSPGCDCTRNVRVQQQPIDTLDLESATSPSNRSPMFATLALHQARHRQRRLRRPARTASRSPGPGGDRQGLDSARSALPAGVKTRGRRITVARTRAPRRGNARRPPRCEDAARERLATPVATSDDVGGGCGTPRRTVSATPRAHSTVILGCRSKVPRARASVAQCAG
jgi:hypothetical protein